MPFRRDTTEVPSNRTSTPPVPIERPPNYPAHWESDVVLSDGGTVHVRPITPADAPAYREFFKRLSPEAIYYRFLAAKSELSDAEVEYFTNVDYIDRFALIAVLDGDILAIARYDREGRKPKAEVAFVVLDAHHGRGLGTVLLEHLAAIAREHGIFRFTAGTLRENWKMLEVFQNAGWRISNRSEDGLIEVAFSIEPTLESQAITEERERLAAARSIARLLEPTSVAVIGASRDHDSVGYCLLRNLLDGGFGGPVYPVNPKAAAISGVAAYPSVSAIPGPVDLAVVAIPAPAVPAVVRECAEKGIPGLVIVSAGFREIGPEGAAREAKVLQTVRMHGMRMIGPNCIGIANTAVGLNATFTPVKPLPGRVGFMSQSGGLGFALLDWTARLGLGVSSFVSAGNLADVTGTDLIQYLEQDDATDVILLYLESFGNPRKFGRIARRASKKKPIVAVKGGRTAAGTRAASVHTAAAASPEVAVSALFRQAGVIRVDTLDELFAVAQVLAAQPLPAGDRVAIVGNSGGPGILAADACEGAGLQVATLSAMTQQTLRELLGPNAAVHNPVDLVAPAGPAGYEQAVRLLLADEGVDALLVTYMPPRVIRPDAVAEAVARAAAGSGKPVVANFLGAGDVPVAFRGGEGRARIPCFPSPEPAAIALARVAHYAEWRRRDPGTVPELKGLDRTRARELVAAVPPGTPDGTWLDIDVATELLACYEIPVLPTVRADDPEAAVAAAEKLGYPVALKAANGALVHKSDVGGLHLDLGSADEVRTAYKAMRMSLGESLGGAVVQPMAPRGIETTVAMSDDRHFGPLVMFGLGGLATELLADRAFCILPLTDVDARELVRAPRGSPLLFGYRRSAPVKVEALEALLVRVGLFAADLHEIAELDLSPVVATPDGVVAVDVRVRVAPYPIGRPDTLRAMG